MNRTLLAAIAAATSLFAGVAAVTGAQPAVAQPADSGAPQWVRVHGSSSALRSVAGPDVVSADYGSFQWLSVPAGQLAALDNAGVRYEVLDEPFVLTLGGERFDPLNGVPPAARGWDAPLAAGPDLRLVQFNGPVRGEWLRALETAGVKAVQYLHPYTYIVWSDAAALDRASTLESVRWTGEYLSHYRVQPEQRGFEAGLRPTMALVSRHAEEGALRSALAASGAVVHDISVVNRHFSVAHFDVSGSRYQDVAGIPGVFTVQAIPQDGGPRSELSNQSIVGAYGAAPNYTIVPGYEDWLIDSGYDGTGVVVSIVDGGIRTSHQDLSSRMVPCVSAGGSPTSCTTSNNSHGTHVAGAVAGTGASGVLLNGFLRGQGVAPGANLVQQRYSAFMNDSGPGSMIPNGMLTIFREAALSQAILANNSWGPGASPRGYDIPTQQMDIVTRDALPEEPGQQPVLPVWSIMNGEGDSSGACAPSSLGSPDEAKNLFAVGSTTLLSGTSQSPNIFNVSSNSGHGPACDGRRVPHIVAPGCNTDSTGSSSDTSFGTMCGTSMASPVVSGAVAVYVEKYRDENDGATPSPAMVKAAFTAAAQNLNGFQNADGGVMGHRPDRFQGYGRIDLDAVVNHPDVFTLDQTHVFSATGEQWQQSLTAANPDEPILIMLAWSDAPGHGSGGAAPAWVNDLDLSVGAAGETFLGNVIGTDGWSATGGTADGMNNLEGVFLRPEQHGGSVDISVLAANIAADALNPHEQGDPAQDFALACYNCVPAGAGNFSVAVTPSALGVCVPDDASFDLSVTGNTGFSDPVTLSVTGNPAGTNATFAANPLTPPSDTTLTIDGIGSATPGQYTLAITGASGGETQQATATLDVFDAAPGAAELLLPEDGATGASLTPTLEWQAANGGSYQVQLASDAGFATLLVDETVSTTQLELATALDEATAYYWRVRADNQCGEGEWSPVFSFTTEGEAVAAADLGITLADSPDPVEAGDQVQLVAQVVNFGPDTATGVSVELTLPPALGFVSGRAARLERTRPTVRGTEWTCADDAGTVTCTLSDAVANAAFAPALVVVAVVADDAAAGTVTTTATVAAGQDDPSAGNDTATTDTEIMGVVDDLFCDGFEDGGDGSCGDGDGAGGEPGFYTDRDEFLANVQAGYYEEDFADVPVGDAGPSLDFSGNGFAYTVTAIGEGSNTLFNDPGLVSTNSALDAVVITFTGEPVTAIGGNFWATNINFAPTGGDIVLTLEDGTTQTYASSVTSFAGFVTETPIVSITIDAPDTDVGNWASIDNVIAGQ